MWQYVVAAAVLLTITTGGVAAADIDGDGLSTVAELQHDTAITDAHTDGDGLDDGREVDLGTDPTDADSDDDGVADGRELDADTDPLKADTDGDGLDDKRELEGPSDPTDADTDTDGVNDSEELDAGTDPTKPDTDDDGLQDSYELENPTDPTNPDTDSDGLEDGREIELGTDPTETDTDGDGLSDSRELELDTDPTAADTDNDGLDDAAELDRETDPTNPDSDEDGLEDGREIEVGTDPLAADTDGDGFEDGVEAKSSDTLPDLHPTEKDVVVEADAVDSASVPDFDEIESAFEEHDMHVHFEVSDTNLPSNGPTHASSTDGDANDIYDYREDEFDNDDLGYHYLLLTDELSDDGVESGYTRVGISANGTMIVQTDQRGSVEATLMHELGHSLGLRQAVFDGIDSRKYTASEYESTMNYNTKSVDFSDSDPFSDWAWIREHMYTPFRNVL
jgi:hypothetical protein